MAYCTAAEVRAQMSGLGGMTSTASDTLLTTGLIPAAESLINDWCNRPDGFVADSVASARVFVGTGKAYLYIDECVAITLVEERDGIDEDYVAWASTDWAAGRGSPERPSLNSTPYELLMVSPGGDYSSFLDGHLRSGYSQDTVRVTAKWGHAVAVPDPIKQAAIIMVARWYTRSEGKWSEAVGTGEFGQIRARLEMDPTAALLLRPYRRVPLARGF